MSSQVLSVSASSAQLPGGVALLPAGWKPAPALPAWRFHGLPPAAGGRPRRHGRAGSPACGAPAADLALKDRPRGGGRKIMRRNGSGW